MKSQILPGTLIFVVAGAAHAEEVHQLDDITVHARPYGMQSLGHIATPVSILTGEDLQNKQSNSIGETLSQELGVTASDFGQGASRPVVRGLSGQRLQVMQDGISSMDISSISADHNVSISPFNADQIEILRGPATLLYGNGASAGVINIVNNRIPEFATGFEADLGYRYNTALAGDAFAGKIGGHHEHLAFHVDFLSLETGDYEAATGQIANSDIDTSDINFGTSIIGDWGFFGFSAGRYDSTYSIPFNPEEPDEFNFIDLNQTRFDIAGQVNKPFSGIENLRLRAAHNDYRHTEFEGPGMPGTRFFNDEWEARMVANHVAIGPWTGVLGLHLRNRSFAGIGDEAFVPPAKLDSLGVFIYEDADWKDFHFEIGGRLETQEIEPTETTGINEISHNTYSVSIGGTYRFSETHSAGITLGRSQRAPALVELLAGGPHLATETFETGDINLGEETANNIDFSIQRNSDAWSWKINLFANYIEDYIFQQFQDTNGDGQADRVDETGTLGAGDLLLIRFEQEDALYYGAEFETSYHFKLGVNHLDLRLFTDVVRGRLQGGDDIPRVSPARLGFSIDFEKSAWHVDLDIINVFEQNDTAELEEGTGGYLMLNAGLAYTFAVADAEARIFVRGSNLLDRDARRHTSFIKQRAPLPGQAAIFGFRMSY